MLTLDRLFDEDRTAPKPSITGKWFEIRLTPDLVAGEILNIGVGFIQSRTKKFYFKLLDSAAPFTSLYGSGAREQFDFLLSVTRDALSAHGPSGNISQHITFGDQRSAQGITVQSILDSLYRSVVTLGRRAAETAELPSIHERKLPRSTETIRKQIRNAFSKHDPKGFTDYWRDAPVQVTADGRQRPIDMQIWQSQTNLYTPRCFGIIISVCYKDTHYRKAFLNGAYHDLTIARSYLAQEEKSKGGIFILRPEDGDSVEIIDNEIDNAVWALQKKFQILPHVENSPPRLLERALEFMQ